jgi:hypothetical protein
MHDLTAQNPSHIDDRNAPLVFATCRSSRCAALRDASVLSATRWAIRMLCFHIRNADCGHVAAVLREQRSILACA